MTGRLRKGRRSPVGTGQHKISPPAVTGLVSGPIAPGLRRWFLAAAMALIAARTWAPAETAADDGSGLPIVMIWIALAGVWAFVARWGGAVFRWSWVDWAVIVLVACIAASALWSMRIAAPRPAVNMLWEWIGLALGFLLLRQLLATARETRGALVLMTALAAAHVAYGLYQDRVVLPQTQAEYRRDPEAALRVAGVWAPPGSPERKQFEDRLLYSQGVLSTFALTNSLAGFLAPWLIVAAGTGLTARGVHRRWQVRGTAALLVLGLAGCLYGTHSRSAMLAAGAGTMLLFAWRSGLGRWLAGWRAWGAAGITAAGLGGLAWAIRTMPWLADARRSLGFRLEYWQATLAMIGEHPWLGVGPGAFQSWYTRYKLPTALEEIKDPHNFLLEVWATAGTVAVTALATALVVGMWKCFRGCEAGRAGFSAIESPPRDGRATSLVDWWMLAAIVASLPLAVLAAAPFGLPTPLLDAPGVATLLISLACAVTLLLQPWVASGPPCGVMAAIALATLLFNLLAAGGIAAPSVAGSLWLLLAVGMQCDDGRHLPREFTRRGAELVAAGAISLLIACYATGYRPVLSRQAAMAMAERDPRRVEEHLRSAAEADDWSAEPWQALAGVAFARWEATVHDDEAQLQAFNAAVDRWLERDRLSSRAWLQAGDWRTAVHVRTGDRRFAEAAVRDYLKAVELYPNDAIRRARLALAQAAAGNHAAADASRKLALALDGQTPHAEKRLPRELRDQLQRIP
jgi:hypothetical protein